jgi:hypothetical protein
MTFTPDPRVDTYIDALPQWQQAICGEVRESVLAADGAETGPEPLEDLAPGRGRPTSTGSRWRRLTEAGEVQQHESLGVGKQNCCYRALAGSGSCQRPFEMAGALGAALVMASQRLILWV